MSLADYEMSPHFTCAQCAGVLERTFTKPPMGFVQPDFQPFKSPIDKKVITSRNELKEHNRTHNVVHMHEKYTDKEVKAMTNHTPTVANHKELIADMAEAVQAVEQGYSPIIESEDVLDHG